MKRQKNKSAAVLWAPGWFTNLAMHSEKLMPWPVTHMRKCSASHSFALWITGFAATMMSFEYKAPDLVLGNPVHQGLCGRTGWYHYSILFAWTHNMSLSENGTCQDLPCTSNPNGLSCFSLSRCLFVGIHMYPLVSDKATIHWVLLSHAVLPHKWIRNSQILMAWNCTGLTELLRRFAMLTMAATSRSTHHTACGVHILAVLDGSFGFGSGNKWNKCEQVTSQTG